MDSDDTLKQEVSEPAGQQLKRAREQKGLSISSVAEAQHLRPAVIQAIEDCDYEQVGTELFLKGYVRTYARQVDLDPDAVIAKLDVELEPLRQQKVEAEELNPLVDIERRKRQKRRIGKFLLFILVIAIAVFFGLRYLDQATAPSESEGTGTADTLSETDNGSGSQEAVDVADGTDDGDASGEPASPDTAAPQEFEEPAEGSAPDVGSGAVETEPAAEPTGEELVAGDSGEASAPAGQQDIPLVDEVERGQADTDRVEGRPAQDDDIDETRVPVVISSTEPAFEESAQPGAAASNARLQMTFSDECWVQVTDSAGNRLVGSLQRDGDQIDVSGRLPIEVVVGAVDAVESIRFDGEPVDMSDFRVVNNRAEFTLDI